MQRTHPRLASLKEVKTSRKALFAECADCGAFLTRRYAIRNHPHKRIKFYRFARTKRAA